MLPGMARRKGTSDVSRLRDAVSSCLEMKSTIRLASSICASSGTWLKSLAMDPFVLGMMLSQCKVVNGVSVVVGAVVVGMMNVLMLDNS